jgi:hypothetical protein
MTVYNMIAMEMTVYEISVVKMTVDKSILDDNVCRGNFFCQIECGKGVIRQNYCK